MTAIRTYAARPASMMAVVLAAAITLALAVSVALIVSDEQVAAPSAATSAPAVETSTSFDELPPGGSTEDKARWGMH